MESIFSSSGRNATATRRSGGARVGKPKPDDVSLPRNQRCSLHAEHMQLKQIRWTRQRRSSMSARGFVFEVQSRGWLINLPNTLRGCGPPGLREIRRYSSMFSDVGEHPNKVAFPLRRAGESHAAVSRSFDDHWQHIETHNCELRRPCFITRCNERHRCSLRANPVIHFARSGRSRQRLSSRNHHGARRMDSRHESSPRREQVSR